jgi:hypothetical protein
MLRMSTLMQQMARIRLGWVARFEGSVVAPLAVTGAGKDWISVFSKVSPFNRCARERKD